LIPKAANATQITAIAINNVRNLNWIRPRGELMRASKSTDGDKFDSCLSSFIEVRPTTLEFSPLDRFRVKRF
jgi:hypothetical protein